MKEKNKNIIGLISGIVLIIIGLVVTVMTLMSRELGTLIVTFFYGIIPFCIGLYMLVNLDKEDEIERVKRIRK